MSFAREYVLANDLFADDRFPEGTGWGDATLTSVICVPMMTLHDECSAVIELFRNNGVDYVEVYRAHSYTYTICDPPNVSAGSAIWTL